MSADPTCADRSLLAVLDREAETLSARWGELLACRPGCDECCRTPFPISRLDAWRLRRAVDRAEPARRRRIHARAARVVSALRDGFPGDPRTGRLAGAEAVLDRFFARHRQLPCPVLDARQGTRELYADRPVICRVHGPPLRFGETRVAPCRHCFRGAEPAVIEAARREPDPDDLEEAILARMDADADGGWHTLVAFAVSGEIARRT